MYMYKLNRLGFLIINGLFLAVVVHAQVSSISALKALFVAGLSTGAQETTAGYYVAGDGGKVCSSIIPLAQRQMMVA